MYARVSGIEIAGGYRWEMIWDGLDTVKYTLTEYNLITI